MFNVSKILVNSYNFLSWLLYTKAKNLETVSKGANSMIGFSTNISKLQYNFKHVYYTKRVVRRSFYC